VGTIYAQNSPGLFAEGNQYYRNGHYEEALQTYLNIMQNGYESGALYYNIGNTYYKQKSMYFPHHQIPAQNYLNFTRVRLLN
jgi:hypothetical protein